MDVAGGRRAGCAFSRWGEACALWVAGFAKGLFGFGGICYYLRVAVLRGEKRCGWRGFWGGGAVACAGRGDRWKNEYSSTDLWDYRGESGLWGLRAAGARGMVDGGVIERGGGQRDGRVGGGGDWDGYGRIDSRASGALWIGGVSVLDWVGLRARVVEGRDAFGALV